MTFAGENYEITLLDKYFEDAFDGYAMTLIGLMFFNFWLFIDYYSDGKENPEKTPIFKLPVFGHSDDYKKLEIYFYIFRKTFVIKNFI